MTCRQVDRTDKILLALAVVVILTWTVWIVPGALREPLVRYGSRGEVLAFPWSNLPGVICGCDSTFLVPWLLVLSLVIFGLRLRTPRPRWRRLCRQPGFVACGMISAGLGLFLLIWLIHQGLARTPWGRTSPYFVLFWEFRASFGPVYGLELIVLTFGLVLAAWALLFLGGFWRAEHSWLDRAGRFLGGSWIAFDVLRSLLYYWGLY